MNRVISHARMLNDTIRARAQNDDLISLEVANLQPSHWVDLSKPVEPGQAPKIKRHGRIFHKAPILNGTVTLMGISGGEPYVPMFEGDAILFSLIMAEKGSLHATQIKTAETYSWLTSKILEGVAPAPSQPAPVHYIPRINL
jgi:hypothetical protein